MEQTEQKKAAPAIVIVEELKSPKKAEEEEGADAERWLLPFAGLVTLLFSLFLVLFSMSQTDMKKFKDVSKSLQGVFKGSGVGEKPDTLKYPSGDRVVPTPIQTKRNFNQAEVPVFERLGTSIKEDGKRLIKEGLTEGFMSADIDERGLVIRLAADSMFDIGDDRINPHILPLLENIALKLKPTNFELRIEGHTDSTPIGTERFPSNWELSSARAIDVVRFFIKKDFSQNRLSAVGYGEYRPIGRNDMEEGRTKNRRIDIVILGTKI